MPRSVIGAAAVSACALLAACGPTRVKPEVHIPKALIQPTSIEVGVFYSREYREYMHRETRWGTDWKIDLGAEHVRMTQKILEQAFAKVTTLDKLPDDGQRAPVQAIVEPVIEQFSFITPRDTGGEFYAVTIRYRLNLDSPSGASIDSFKMTGYGTADASGMSSDKPMAAAIAAAMRDGAAKFLTQFPDQPAVVKLSRGEAIAAGEGGRGTTEAEEVPMLD